MRPSGPALILLALATAAPAQGVSLGELPAVARARSERQRPAQLAALEPFLADLRTEYRRNAPILDDTIQKVAGLGDAVVPLLIDFLTPADLEDKRSRALAANSARVLARLEPRAHLDTWIDLLDGDHPLGRREALRLIDAAGPDPRSAAALLRNFPRLTDPFDAAAALRAAIAVETPALAPLALEALKSPEAEVRAQVLEYLTRFEFSEGSQAVVVALRRETDSSLLSRYIDNLRKTTRADAAVADALVPLIEGVRIEPEDLRQLVAALATIAPEDHKETRRVLLELLERGETGELGIQAALTLQALGEKRGYRVLFDTLEKRLRERRGDAGPYVDLADAFFAFERHPEAIRNYEQAIKFSQVNSRQAAYRLQIARCEAHRDSIPRMVRALKDSGVSAATIRAEASRDPVFQAALEKDLAVRFLESIDR